MDLLGILGIVIGLLIAWWEYHRAKKAEAELARFLRDLPGQLVENVSRFVAHPQDPAPNPEIRSKENYSSAQYFDIDNDGSDELIVQFPAGSHGSAIQIYSFEGNDFHLKAESWSGTPCGFEIDTSDPAYSPLLRSVEQSSAADVSYAAGLRDVVWYKLIGNELVEHKRKLPSQDEIDDRVAMEREFGEVQGSAP